MTTLRLPLAPSQRLPPLGETFCLQHPSSSANGVSVIDNHTGKQIFHQEYGKNEGRVFNFAMSPSGKYFGYWAEKYERKGFFYVYQRSPLKLLHKIPSPNSWDWDRGAEFSVSEKRLYLQSYTNSVVVDVDSGKTLQLFKVSLLVMMILR